MRYFRFATAFCFFFPITSAAVAGSEDTAIKSSWTQWRGPNRNGSVEGPHWPERMENDSVTRLWRIPLDPSYSGPIITDELVFTTETKNKQSEAVIALDRKTGDQKWRTEWNGAMTVPFFAASNGSWIRSTPAFDGESLYVAGMRDVLVCLDAKSGRENWRFDFPEKLKSALPAFGFVCSPLVDGEFVFVQAGSSFVKLNKKTGEVAWRTLKDEGGMNGSAFSSPIVTELAGQRQMIVQTREKLVGVNLESGETLWEKVVPAFRGMNILTPVVFEDSLFTSSYQNKSWLFTLSKAGDHFQVGEGWSNGAQGYMSTPVVVDGHAYLHLQNQRFTCIDLKTGERKWTSQPYGKYASLIAQGDKILALDSNGQLVYFKANPQEFNLIDKIKVSESETWAHLGIVDDELFIRELDGLSVFRWSRPENK